MANELYEFLPLAVLGLVAFLLVFVTLVLNRLVGPKHATASKLTNYECGEKATPGARGPIDVQYYMFILTFLVFDVEAMFLIPFAVRFKEIGIGPIVAVAVFVGLILVGYLWEIRKRLLSWRALE